MLTVNTEKKLLMHSVIVSLAFSVLGITAGLYTGSRLLLMDGLYAFMGVLLSWLSYAAAKFMGENDWKRFPFGKAVVEPLVIMIKYVIILLVLIFSVVGSAYSLATGGSPVNVEMALGYATFSTVICFFMHWHIRRKSKRVNSSLLTAESTQWLFDTYESIGVLVTFGLVLLLGRLNILTAYLDYVDPLVVIIMASFFAKVPVLSIRQALRDLLGMSPEGELSTNLQQMTEEIEEKYLIQETFLRVSKRRRMLRVEIDFIVDEASLVQSVEAQDLVREELYQRMKPIKTDKWITVAFTSNRKWAV